MRKLLTFSFLMLSASYAEISFQAIKGIHGIKKGEKASIFKEGFEHLSPIWGFLAIKTGMIENLRFFGNYEFGWDKDDISKREYSSDKGKDGITKLVRMLFPSTGGQLTTTAGHEGNLGKKMTSALVGALLTKIQQIRSKNEKLTVFDIPDKNVLDDIKNITGYNKDFERYNTAKVILEKTKEAFTKAQNNLYEKISEENKKAFEEFCTTIDIEKLPKELSKELENQWKSTIDGWKNTKIITEEEKQEEKQEKKEEKNIDKPEKEKIENSNEKKKQDRTRKNDKPNKDFTTSGFISSFRQLINANNDLKKYEQETPGLLKFNQFQETDNINTYMNHLILECLENEKNGFYPKHTTEHIVLAFLWLHFNTKNDIKEMYESLDERYIQKGLIKDINDDLLTDNDLPHDEYDLSNKNLEEAVQLVYSNSYFGNYTPYVSGESLISNSETHYYDRSKITDKNNLDNRKSGEIKDKTGYADCVEVSQRHLFNFVLFDGEKFNLKNLESKLQKIENWEPNSAFLNMKEWFYKNQQPTKDKANAGDINTRSAWNGVMGDLNHDCSFYQSLNEKEKQFYKVYYHRVIPNVEGETRNELHPGFINRLNVIEHVLGVRLEELGTPEERKDIEEWTKILIDESAKETTPKYKEAYQNYVVTKMKIFLNAAKNTEYSFDIQTFNIGNIKKGKYIDGHPYDLFFLTGAMNEMRIVGERNKRNFEFVIESSYGHGVTRFISEKEKNKKFIINDKNTLLAAYLKETNEPFYKLYANGVLSDFDKRRMFLENFIEQKDFKTYSEIIQCVFAQMGLDDEMILYWNVDSLNKILNKYNNPNEIFKHVPPIQPSVLNDIGLGRDFSNVRVNDKDCLWLQTLPLNTILPNSLKELIISKDENVDLSQFSEEMQLEKLEIKGHIIDGAINLKQLKSLNITTENALKDLVLPANLINLNLTLQNDDDLTDDFDFSQLKGGQDLENCTISAKNIEGNISFNKLKSLDLCALSFGEFVLPNTLKILNLTLNWRNNTLDLSHLTGGENLEELSISTQKISNTKDFFSKTKKLKKLILDLDSAENLDVSELGIEELKFSAQKNASLTLPNQFKDLHMVYICDEESRNSKAILKGVEEIENFRLYGPISIEGNQKLKIQKLRINETNNIDLNRIESLEILSIDNGEGVVNVSHIEGLKEINYPLKIKLIFKKTEGLTIKNLNDEIVFKENQLRDKEHLMLIDNGNNTFTLKTKWS